MRKFLTLLLACFFLLVPATTPCTAPVPPVRIDIWGAIDMSTFSSVKEAVDAAKTAGASRLDIRINSPGGEILATFLIIDVIRESNIPTTCTVGVMAASAAAILLESPACGERVVGSSSLVMFHGGASEVKGKQRAMENDLVSLRAMDQAVAQTIARRLGMTPEQYLDLVVERGRDLWFVGADAVKAKVADRVIPLPAPAR